MATKTKVKKITKMSKKNAGKAGTAFPGKTKKQSTKGGY